MSAPIQVSAVSTTTAGANNSPTLSNVRRGSLLVLTVSWAAQSSTAPPTVSGWSTAEAGTGQSFVGGLAYLGSCVFYKENAAAGTHTPVIVPGTGTASQATTAILSEFASSLAVGSLDTAAHTHAVGNNATSGDTGTTAATSSANRLVIATLCTADETGAPRANLGYSAPASSGYTTLGTLQDTSPGTMGIQSSYKNVTSTGTQTASWTWTYSSGFMGSVVAFDLGSLTKVWSGSAWVSKPVKVWNGSAWVIKPLKIWNGSVWR